MIRPLLCVLLTAFSASAQSIEERARDMLEKALQSGNPDTRLQAVSALSLGGPREPFLTNLEQTLQDKDVHVRLAAVSSLADLKTKRTTALLRKALDDNAAEVSFAAAKVLYGQNDPAGKEALLAALSGESKITSGALTKAKRDALRLVHTPKPMFMFALKQGVGLVPVPGLGEGISSMQAILSDPGVSGRATAALMLAKEKDTATLQALREALLDKDASVRAAAVHALALRNDPALEEDLMPLLEDKKENVRLRAAAGVLRLELIKKTRRTAAMKTAGAKRP